MYKDDATLRQSSAEWYTAPQAERMQGMHVVELETISLQQKLLLLCM